MLMKASCYAKSWKKNTYLKNQVYMPAVRTCIAYQEAFTQWSRYMKSLIELSNKKLSI